MITVSSSVALTLETRKCPNSSTADRRTGTCVVNMAMWWNSPRPPCLTGTVRKNLFPSLENTGSWFCNTPKEQHGVQQERSLTYFRRWVDHWSEVQSSPAWTARAQSFLHVSEREDRQFTTGQLDSFTDLKKTSHGVCVFPDRRHNKSFTFLLIH